MSMENNINIVVFHFLFKKRKFFCYQQHFQIFKQSEFQSTKNHCKKKKNLLWRSNLFEVENDWILRICLPEPFTVGCYRKRII